MTRGTINVRLRPVKLAFLVNPKDKDSLLKAIEINTFLWGGMFNPIIPTYKRIPSKWQDGPFKNPNAQSVISGYLDNFDPDYVIPMGECSGYSLDVGNREKIDDVSEILAPVEKDGTPKYGIGLFEVLNHFFEEELKFQRRYPQDICVLRFGARFRLFLASVFGTLSKNIDTIFWEHFAEALEANQMDCSTSNYTEFFNPKKLFLRRMTRLYLETSGKRKQCIFFLDATNTLDVMDYWNLRAIGWEVFPVPKQFIQSDKTKLPILDLIKENYLPRHLGPQIHQRATILKSRSVSEDEHQHFLSLLEKSKVISQTWYPRMWDEWARDADQVECCELEADTAEHDVSSNGEAIPFKSLAPKFLSGFGGVNPRFANEIEWSLYDDQVLFAEVIPESDRKLALFIVGSGLPKNWRLFRKGLIYLSYFSAETLFLVMPHAEGIFTKWLELKGWTVKLSPPGRIAKQMVQQLRGVYGIWILAKEGIIQLLGKMNSSDQKSLSEEFVRGEIQKIGNQAVFKMSGERILQHLIAEKVFQLGMEIQCPVCTQFSWYSVKGADYELQCPKCLELLPFPSASKEIKWLYRTLGPFSLPNQAHGAYTVLLTLRFFSKITFSSSAATPLMSFTAEKGKMEMEADLALFFQESESRHSKMDLIFAECKTFNSFQKDDVDKMINLSKIFPRAVLVFATLRKSLNNEEKTILRPVANRSRKSRKNNQPFNPVLILTGIELFSESHFIQNWEEAGGLHAKLAQNYPPINLLELCDFTQQIYLEMDSWDQWIEKQLGNVTTSTVPIWATKESETL